MKRIGGINGSRSRSLPGERTIRARQGVALFNQSLLSGGTNIARAALIAVSKQWAGVPGASVHLGAYGKAIQ